MGPASIKSQCSFAELLPIRATYDHFMRRTKVFVAIVSVLVALLGMTTIYPAHAASKRLVEFGTGEVAWAVVNDGVMGGVSNSQFSTRRGIATFNGTVSLENNGGFASIRSTSALAPFPPSATKFQLRVKGDGKAYQFTVDSNAGWYWFTMTPEKGKWTIITVPYAALVPVTRFGEPTERVRFDGTQTVSRLGILISNKRAEKFSISIDWVALTD
jgi:NADH dehydrogenase [ubiquinone] 1 alpha subcomplex assembly factor 1